MTEPTIADVTCPDPVEQRRRDIVRMDHGLTPTTEHELRQCRCCGTWTRDDLCHLCGTW